MALLRAFLFFQRFEKTLSFQLIDHCFINELALLIPHSILETNSAALRKPVDLSAAGRRICRQYHHRSP